MIHPSFFRGWTGIVVLAVLMIGAGAALAAGREPQMQKGKIYQPTYPLITDSDMYCSFGALDGPRPQIKITGAERQEERVQFGDGDVVYLNGGTRQGLAADQIYLILSISNEVDVKSPRTGKNYGPLVQREGRGRVISVESDKAVLRLEKTCAVVSVGDYAVPFTPGKTVIGKNTGFVPYAGEHREAVKGSIIYLGGELNQIGTGSWAIIDLGSQEGLQPGNQLTVSTTAGEKLPRHGIGNAVVIDVQSHTATIKILEAGDAIRLGDQVEVK
jgi:hypothetical protein